ncbi:alanine racemase [Paenibacillus sp.]|uniref:alanine racemase n=1 Tax=Paenibacillus sp. TaxID=58172 RepID=UPI002D659173|nr:alanine racemase [Paenibacillus sp.]HZG86193.1 alanine racemase [Paenibacillus sp.]
MDTYRWTRAEIDLDALHHNLGQFQAALGPDIKLMAVVKANAYGHGAVKVAEEAIRFGVEYLAVAFLDEALELRHFGIEAPILVLGYTPAAGVDVARSHGITLTVFDDEVLEAARTDDPAVSPLKIHVKVDTGMGRIGITDEGEAIRFLGKALDTPGVEVEGLFTHYACADECDKSHIQGQYRKFARLLDTFRARGVEFRYVHAGNSATGIDTPEYTCNMLRLGVGMYGLYPSEEVNRARVRLKPVMSLKTGIVMVKTLPQGCGISYGARYVTQRDGETIATLPIGYADGYSRLLSGKAEALIRGRRAPVVGNICMDQCMVRVDDGEAAVGDEVVLFGAQGGESIAVEELASKLGTINYEITCMVSHRVPRVYVKGGRVAEFHNPLLHFTSQKDIQC